MPLTNLQRVRLFINDPSTGAGNPDNATGTGSPLYSDDQISDILDQYATFAAYPNCLFAAADLCEMRMAHAAERSVSASIGGTLTHKSEKIADYWGKLAAKYREPAAAIISGANDGMLWDIAEPGGTEFQQTDILISRLIDEDL